MDCQPVARAMLVVVWATCSFPASRGVVTIGYGPITSEGDIAALDQLDSQEPG